MKQKTLSILLAVLMSIVASVALAYDYDCVVDGIYYKRLTGTIFEVTYGENKYSGDVVIPPKATYMGKTHTVLSIGEDAFSGCSNLTSVTIPYSVKDIGYDAFKTCSGLTSVTIPNTVTWFGDDAFSGSHNTYSLTFSFTLL